MREGNREMEICLQLFGKVELLYLKRVQLFHGFVLLPCVLSYVDSIEAILRGGKFGRGNVQFAGRSGKTGPEELSRDSVRDN